MRLKIYSHRDAVVRTPAKPITPEFLSSAAGQTLVVNMIETMHDANGIGLAAPQIGQSLRLATIAFRDGDLVMGNPEILDPSEEMRTEEEGCLSVPGVFGTVKRNRALRVRFLDANGEPQELEAKGLFARVIQHEVDHLNGVVYIDRTTNFTKGRP